MSAPIRIAHIIYSGLGGHGSVFSSFVTGDQMGQVKNFALYYGVEALNDDYRIFCESSGLTFAYIPKAPGLDRKSWQAIQDQLQVWQPQLLIIHSCYTIIPAAQYAKRVRIPLITVEHTANQYKSTKDWIWSWLAMRRSDRVIFLTPTYKQEVKQRFKAFFQASKAYIVPNGLNTDVFSPSEKETEKQHMLIGMHARLAPPKDFGTLIRALASLRKSASQYDFRLQIAGDGVFRAELEALVDELNLRPYVSFVGMLNEQGVVEFLRNTDLYVQATFGETMSTAVMQAMAVKLPIVVSDIEGTRNMIQEDETGLFFPNKQPEALAAQLLRLATDKVFRDQIAKNACDYAQKNYSHIRMFKRYWELFSHLLHTSKVEKANI